MSKLKDITGQRFGRLVAIRRVPNHPQYGQARWLFKCDCGSEHIQYGYIVRYGAAKSCGCYSRDNPAHLKHGMAGTPEHHTWSSMRGRCQNKRNAAYAAYGGRGISVCSRWQSFENFYADMGPRPSPRHTLDRTDNNGPYAPENCRWADKRTQVRNRRTATLFSYLGQKKNLADWADQFGLPYKTVWTRYKNGWRGDRLFSPLGPTSGKK